MLFIPIKEIIILIIVNGIIKPVAFIIDLKPNLFDTNIPIKKNSNIYNLLNSLKYTICSIAQKSISVIEEDTKNNIINKVLIIIFKKFPPKKYEISIMSEEGKILKRFNIIFKIINEIISKKSKFINVPVLVVLTKV